MASRTWRRRIGDWGMYRGIKDQDDKEVVKGGKVLQRAATPAEPEGQLRRGIMKRRTGLVADAMTRNRTRCGYACLPSHQARECSGSAGALKGKIRAGVKGTKRLGGSAVCWLLWAGRAVPVHRLRMPFSLVLHSALSLSTAVGSGEQVRFTAS